MSMASNERFGPVILQLRQNHAFRKQFGHKIGFLDIGPRLPKSDNIQDTSNWKRTVQCSFGLDFMYDYKNIRGLFNSHGKVRVKMMDKNQRSEIRLTSICRALTEFQVPWQDKVPQLACQVCPVLNPRNPDYGNTTVVYSGASAERQLIFANMAENPIQWFYAFFTQELGYHPDMVFALLRRSFPGSDNDIIVADEDATWNPESLTVTTVASLRQEQSLQDDIDEGLLLPLSELIRSRKRVDDGTERAKMFSGRGYHPDSEIPD